MDFSIIVWIFQHVVKQWYLGLKIEKFFSRVEKNMKRQWKHSQRSGVLNFYSAMTWLKNVKKKTTITNIGFCLAVQLFEYHQNL